MSRPGKAESPILATTENSARVGSNASQKSPSRGILERATKSDSIRLNELPPLPSSTASSHASSQRDEAEANDCFYKVIDVAIDGTGAETRVECYTRDKLRNLRDQIPSQRENTIRVILDGGPEPDNFRGFRIPKPDDTCMQPLLVRPALPDGPSYLPILRRMLSEDFAGSTDWYEAEYFVEHREGCSNVRGSYTGPLGIEYELSDVKFTVDRSMNGHTTMFCSAPDASIQFNTGSAQPICTNANWRCLKALDLSLEEGILSLQCNNRNRLQSLCLLLLINLSTILELNATFLHQFVASFSVTYKVREIGERGSLSTIELELFGSQIAVLREIENQTCDISHAIEYVSTMLKMSIASSTVTEKTLSSQLFAEGLQQECNFHKFRAARARETHAEIYGILSNRINAKQADSVTQLTLLAAIFLPLSLAAGVLSMQTRFSELHLLLYDFVGVMFVLGTVAAFFASINRYGDRIYDKVLDETYGWVVGSPSVRKHLKHILFVIWWLALLISFLIGMLKDVILGLKVLGFEAAAIIGLWLLSLKGIGIGYIYYEKRKYRKGVEQM